MSPQLLTSDVVGMYEKFLFYGEPKTGKTFAALTAPDPIYVISVGNVNEIKTRFSRDFREKHPEKEIYFDVAEESMDERGQFDEAVGFDNVCDLLDRALDLDADPDEDFSFNSLVIDNATVLGNYAMNKSMEVNYDSAKGKSKTALSKLRESNIVIPGDNDWMSQMSLMGQFVSWLFRLKKHVVLVAHEWHETTTDRASHQTIITAAKPLFTGKQRTDIPALFDNLWRFQRNAQFFEARTIGTDQPFSITAGTRVGGVLPSPYRDVNLTNAIRELQEAAQEE